ncbi:hypothetical protein SR1949_41380 [Sphaerospermopsis reniformis]|uniref:Uncharacterized protein n=1 Tax=Sphaerospermopsis reniformis TaxID=531300 RepID=A0A480A2D6_9CYAN|nr:hypothetical protein [Sphaerospermopsis reniformis]GCL39017.1 hypothetical protein SR1949_41380 [Sphaerospermopsis reniformis]
MMDDSKKIKIEKLVIEESEVIEGLKNGTLERYGCAIRRTSSLAITHFIVEPPEITQKLQEAPSKKLLNSGESSSNQPQDELNFTDIIDLCGEVINKLNEDKIPIPDGKYQPISPEKIFVISDTYNGYSSLATNQLSSILQVSQIAAAASVINLGVSVAGFAYMGYKLNQIQKSLSDIQEQVETGFKNLNNKLDGISGQLSYLCLLAQNSYERQKRLEKALHEIHRLLLVQMLVKLNATIQDYLLFGDKSTRDTIRTTEEVRGTLLDQATRVEASLDTASLLTADLSINGWVIALMTKAQLLARLGRYDDAIQILTNDIKCYKSIVEKWAAVLIKGKFEPKLATAYRFGIPDLSKHISTERVKRIARISPIDRKIKNNRINEIINKAQVELMLERYSHWGESWVYEQVAIAEYLDGMSETLAKLESFCLFLVECQKRGINITEDLFVNLTACNNLYLLPVIK